MIEACDSNYLQLLCSQLELCYDLDRGRPLVELLLIKVSRQHRLAFACRSRVCLSTMPVADASSCMPDFQPLNLSNALEKNSSEGGLSQYHFYTFSKLYLAQMQLDLLKWLKSCLPERKYIVLGEA